MALTRCQEGHLFSSRRYGNICPYCNKTVILSSRRADAEDPDGRYGDSMPYIGDLEVMDPVTGWLVCVEGPSKGRDYRILHEKNFLGRSDGMDIQILGDNHIAKRNHAVFIYEPKNRQTLLLPGTSQGLVYINGDAVYAPVVLSNYDSIEIGKSRFIFVGCCGENFEWSEVDQKALDENPDKQI